MDDEVNGAESNRAGHSQETCEGGTESTLSVTHEFCHSGEGGVVVQVVLVHNETIIMVVYWIVSDSVLEFVMAEVEVVVISPPQ